MPATYLLFDSCRISLIVRLHGQYRARWASCMYVSLLMSWTDSSTTTNFTSVKLRSLRRTAENRFNCSDTLLEYLYDLYLYDFILLFTYSQKYGSFYSTTFSWRLLCSLYKWVTTPSERIITIDCIFIYSLWSLLSTAYKVFKYYKVKYYIQSVVIINGPFSWLTN